MTKKVQESAEELHEIPEDLKLIKMKYKQEYLYLTAMFVEWSEQDLLSILEETTGDVETAVTRISEGHAQQWTTSTSARKKERKSKLSHNDDDNANGSGSRPERGEFSGRGGRGTRGGRGGRGTRGRGGSSMGTSSYNSRTELKKKANINNGESWGAADSSNVQASVPSEWPTDDSWGAATSNNATNDSLDAHVDISASDSRDSKPIAKITPSTPKKSVRKPTAQTSSEWPVDDSWNAAASNSVATGDSWNATTDSWSGSYGDEKIPLKTIPKTSVPKVVPSSWAELLKRPEVVEPVTEKQTATLHNSPTIVTDSKSYETKKEPVSEKHSIEIKKEFRQAPSSVLSPIKTYSRAASPDRKPAVKASPISASSVPEPTSSGPPGLKQTLQPKASRTPLKQDAPIGISPSATVSSLGMRFGTLAVGHDEDQASISASAMNPQNVDPQAAIRAQQHASTMPPQIGHMPIGTGFGHLGDYPNAYVNDPQARHMPMGYYDPRFSADISTTSSALPATSLPLGSQTSSASNPIAQQPGMIPQQMSHMPYAAYYPYYPVHPNAYPPQNYGQQQQFMNKSQMYPYANVQTAASIPSSTTSAATSTTQPKPAQNAYGYQGGSIGQQPSFGYEDARMQSDYKNQSGAYSQQPSMYQNFAMSGQQTHVQASSSSNTASKPQQQVPLTGQRGAPATSGSQRQGSYDKYAPPAAATATNMNGYYQMAAQQQQYGYPQMMHQQYQQNGSFYGTGQQQQQRGQVQQQQPQGQYWGTAEN